jgi:hypothetical protein
VAFADASDCPADVSHLRVRDRVRDRRDLLIVEHLAVGTDYACDALAGIIA